jgi:tetratricopeptide (TPR) repeat protein
MALLNRSAKGRRAIPFFLALIAATLVACQSEEEKLVAFMERGDAYKSSEEFKEAIIEYRNVLQIDPNHVGAHRALGESYFRVNQFKEGYWELSETVRLDPENVQARINYSGVALAAKQFDEVLTQADALLELAPDNATGYILRGQALSALDREEEVEAMLIKAIELEPENDKFRMVVAAYYQSTREFDKAEAQLKYAVNLEDTGLAQNNLGRLYTLMGDRDEEAEASFQKVLDMRLERFENPEEDADPERVKRGVINAYRTLASFYALRRRTDDALALLDVAIAKVPDDTELYYLASQYHRSVGDSETADKLVVAASQIDPSSPQPFLVLSTLLSSKGDVEGALAAAQLAREADPLSVQARLRVAELKVDLGYRTNDDQKIAEGQELVDGVLDENPNSAEALFVEAKILVAAGRSDQAIDRLRAALDIRPDWPQAHFILGSALALSGEKQRARAELARAVELQPRLLEARELLIRIHAELAEYEYAIENGLVFLKARPDNDAIRIVVAQAMVRLGKIEEAEALLAVIPEEGRGVEALFAVGRLHLARGETEAARKAFLAANEQLPNNARLLNSLLAIDRRSDRLDESIARIDAAIEARPDDATLRHLRGLAAISARNLSSAELSFKKSIELDPNRLDSYQQLAGIYQVTGRMDDTLALYENAVVIQPESAPPHYFLAVLYEMKGRIPDAKKQYELAIKYDSSLGEAKNNLAYLMAEEGEDLDRALKLAQEAKAAMPDLPNAADTLGWVLYKRGVASAAIGYLREAVQMSDPDDPGRGEISAHLAQAYEATGDTTRAIEALEDALAHFDRLKQEGKLQAEPGWAEYARSNIERLKAASG